MIAIVQGEFLSKRSGKTGDGKVYESTTILSGDETLTIYGYDPGDGVKRMDRVDVRCEIRLDRKNGKQYINYVPKA